MGGSNTDLMKDIKSSHAKLTLSSQSFISQAIEFDTLMAQLEKKFKEIEEKEVAVERREKEVEERTQQLQERERKCIEKEREIDARDKEVKAKEAKWVATEKRMLQNVAKLPNLVNLNISGTRFTTSKEKLLKHKGSLFEEILESDHPQLTSGGEIFLDRDPKQFQHVIRYLLSGDVEAPPSTNKRRRIEQEFAHFKIPVKFKESLVPGLSELGENKLAAKIMEWLPAKQFKLIYKASVHGHGAVDFHKHCDNKGPTLVVIQLAHGSVFGGYSPNSWDCSDAVKYHYDGFTFTLSNPRNIPPTKFTDPAKFNSIYCAAEYSAVFGLEREVAEKIADDPSNIPIPCTYTYSSSKKIIPFSNNLYGPTEMEVFAVF